MSGSSMGCEGEGGPLERKAVVGVVAIGRNEGDRLQRCLRSVVDRAGAVVYVDSGSSDGSVEFARSMGIDVVELDLNRPFTAARARNAGVEALLETEPETDYVQFVDGDCEVVPGWIDCALAELEERDGAAVVFGRRRERSPEASVYNLLCDLEWDVPVGEAASCGGDALFRVKALREVGLFDPEMIAGEEPELCVRLRRAGWKIFRIDHEMTLHDAAVTRLSQWWRRCRRAGHAYAEGAALHGRRPWRHNVRNVRSILLWGGLLPGAAVATGILGFWWPPLWLLPVAVVLLYLLQLARVARARRRRGDSPAVARTYARYTLLGKLPELLGVLSYWGNRLRGKKRSLIEYK